MLYSTGEDGRDHVTTWLNRVGNTPVFGTTLGHSQETVDDPIFHQLLANALLHVTGHITVEGKAEPGYEAPSTPLANGRFSAPEGVAYLGDCPRKEMAKAIGPCYIGCTLNPLHWGEETADCKQECVSRLPSSDELIEICSAQGPVEH